MPKVYIIILNYNGWMDTIECLESVLKLNYKNFQVIVVDNNSPNNSLLYINKWAIGQIDARTKNNQLTHLTAPFEKKPLFVQNFSISEEKKTIDLENNSNIIFIQAGENKGFAAGNNIGIQFALNQSNCDFVWLLNNDTVVEKDALSKLVEHFDLSTEKIGILGSKLLYYHNPTEIQAIAGKYNKWLCTTSHIGGNSTDNGQFDSPHAPIAADYIVGASMFVSRDFIEDVGLMTEDYFLYFEELDWSFRAKRKGWIIDVCTKSKVYHKEGASINANENKSELADYYSLRNRLLFTKRFSPIALPSVHLSLLGVAVNRLRRGQPERLKLIFKVLFGRSR